MGGKGDREPQRDSCCFRYSGQGRPHGDRRLAGDEEVRHTDLIDDPFRGNKKNGECKGFEAEELTSGDQDNLV